MQNVSDGSKVVGPAGGTLLFLITPIPSSVKDVLHLRSGKRRTTNTLAMEISRDEFLEMVHDLVSCRWSLQTVCSVRLQREDAVRMWWRVSDISDRWGCFGECAPSILGVFSVLKCRVTAVLRLNHHVQEAQGNDVLLSHQVESFCSIMLYTIAATHRLQWSPCNSKIWDCYKSTGSMQGTNAVSPNKMWIKTVHI